VRTILAKISMVLVVGGVVALAQEVAAPEVAFLSPSEDAILQDNVSIVVEGRNFQDLTTFGFADFFYETPSERVHLGTDKNTFDGLSLGWDTSSVPDGPFAIFQTLQITEQI